MIPSLTEKALKREWARANLRLHLAQKYAAEGPKNPPELGTRVAQNEAWTDYQREARSCR